MMFKLLAGRVFAATGLTTIKRFLAHKKRIIRISRTWKGMRKRAVPHSVPLSSGAGGGTRRQTCPSVSEFLASHHWRAAQVSPQGRYRLGVLFFVILLDKQKNDAPRRAKQTICTTACLHIDVSSFIE
jgi:hypothetical protein